MPHRPKGGKTIAKGTGYKTAKKTHPGPARSHPDNSVGEHHSVNRKEGVGGEGGENKAGSKGGIVRSSKKWKNRCRERRKKKRKNQGEKGEEQKKTTIKLSRS